MAHEAIHTDANDASNTTNPEHAEHHIVTPLQYLYVFATLLFFTGVTVWASPVSRRPSSSSSSCTPPTSRA